MTSNPAISTDPLTRALAFAFDAEGGYLSASEANRVGDPGGETKYGISKRSYPHLDIASLTPAQAEAIYRADFWPHFAALPALVAFVAFDWGINSGPVRARRVAFAAVAAHPGNPLAAASEVLAERRKFLTRLGRRRPKVVRGWLNRIDRQVVALRHYAEELGLGPAQGLPGVPRTAVERVRAA